MTTGAHVIVFSKDADADRVFIREHLGFAHVDAGLPAPSPAARLLARGQVADRVAQGSPGSNRLPTADCCLPFGQIQRYIRHN